MEIINLLTPLQIFQNLGDDAIAASVDKLKRKSLPKGETLFKQGDPGDALYIIASGALRVSVHTPETGTFVNDFKSGDSVGEMSLLTGQPRTATITALEDSELLYLTKSDFDELAEKFPGLIIGLSNQLLPHFLRDQTRAALKNFFGDMDEGLLRDLLKSLDCGRCHSGEVLFNQGEAGNAMYIVTQGRLRSVVKNDDGTERIISEAGAGECVGEFSLLAESGSPESMQAATVYATRLTDMIIITRPVFESLSQRYPQALIRLTRKIAQRAVSISNPKTARKDNMVITLLPARFDQPTGEFVAQLDEALSTLGSTLSLNAARFDQLYGKKGVSQTNLDNPFSALINAWLDEREREHNYTVYDVQPVLDKSGRLTSWAQRCIEDADLILLIGAGDGNPNPSEIEQQLLSTRTRARMELVLTHPADCPLPTGTAAWLSQRKSDSFPISAHHHVRSGNKADFRRLARRIVGKPVGIAFAGGGARGWSHIGVLRALEEANIEADWVAGASMGSIVAAGSALGWSSAQFTEIAAKFSNSKKLLDYTFPYASFTSTAQITNLLKEFYNNDIEDTWRPFFCIAANLTEVKEVVQNTGALWKAVRASMAFPGVFAPVLDNNGSVLIDGGAANNLPIDRMREVCPTGTVIGVDLLTGSSVSEKYNFDDSLSGWQALAGRVFPFPQKIYAPHIFTIMAGLVDGACRYRLNEVWRSADLLIQIPVQTYGLLDFDKYAEIIEAGYRAGSEQLKNFEL